MEGLTPGQIWIMNLAKTTPLAGAPQGSNLWPFMEMKNPDGSQGCKGEEVDDLLKRGLMRSAPLPGGPVLHEESTNPDIPDANCTVEIMLTAAGLAALHEIEVKDW